MGDLEKVTVSRDTAKLTISAEAGVTGRLEVLDASQIEAVLEIPDNREHGNKSKLFFKSGHSITVRETIDEVFKNLGRKPSGWTGGSFPRRA